VPLALGSDTGGSVRQPAAFCGVLASSRPTAGSRAYGLVAFASSLDHVGVFAREAADLALALNVLAGPDGEDATALTTPPPPPELEPLGAKGLRIG
jgi:aspartyl-tRNA(Asn)/glutamyl-tRNA(Gln) amidotransferase subunit A